MDKEMFGTEKARLYESSLCDFADEASVIDYGAIMVCRGGTATVRVDFKEWTLCRRAVITLFPGDVVALGDASSDFSVQVLRYDAALLREASLQLEQTVYSLLRKDRCRCDTPVVADIVETMFALLRIYFRQPDCGCIDQLVLYQLKAFFLGFYDWIVRNKTPVAADSHSRRTNELFNMFMELLERSYKQSHDVAYYAGQLSITPKYLGTIVGRMTGHTPKSIIDHYVVLRIKLQLRTCEMSVKQMACDYNFSDVSFFCRYFRQHTGLTPQQYRKTHNR